MKIIAIIPARYGSKRLLAKPLIKIKNKPLVQLTYEAVLDSKLFDAIFIATESKKIQQVTSAFGGTCIMTSEHCKNGTERCAELANKLNFHNNDLIVNIQCDEPFIQKKHLKSLIALFKKNTEIGTLLSLIKDDDIKDPSIVKAVKKEDNTIIDFNRKKSQLNTKFQLYKHVGIYGYTKKILMEITLLKKTKRELIERLEQLRWIQNNYTISAAVIVEDLMSINTENDIKNLEK
tara:strand:- start:10796 stop:11497 length:702 start_codon:yes stop_codon:yes gene_type:complete